MTTAPPGIVSAPSMLIGLLLAVLACAASAAHAQVPHAPSDPATLAKGRDIYRQHCAACHGTNGEGATGWQQADRLGEMPAPPHDSEGHTWKHSDAMLYRIVQSGWRDRFNKTQRLTMPGFSTTLSPAETRAVITFLKTLWKPEQRIFQADESRNAPFPTKSP